MSSTPSHLNNQPEVRLTKTEQYRENYANSVQVRMSVWDCQLVFGTVQEHTAESVTLESFQGVYLSPQQAKALNNILTQNIAQYERTFGVLSLEPQITPPGGVN